MSTQIRPILQFSANQSILSKSQRHPILRRKVASAEGFFIMICNPHAVGGYLQGASGVGAGADDVQGLPFLSIY
jgi:hypothetical protein